MISILATPLARWIGAALLVAAILGGIYAKGRMDYKSKVDVEAKAQALLNKAETKVRDNITKKSEVNRAKSATVIASTYAALRMRSPASGSQVSAVPDPATKPDAAAAHYVSIAPDLAERCAQTTQQLADLQEWVSDQQGVE